MNFYEKLITILAIIILFYVFYGLSKHNLFQFNKESFRTKKCNSEEESLCKGVEGFVATPKSELSGLDNTGLPISVSSMKKNITGETLKEYAIKGSYNTAVTGKYVNLDMIRYVLSRGCRFVDFEVLFFNDKAVVSTTSDPNYMVIDTENIIPLSSALSSTVSQAFSRPSPNFKDPLFIHLRIKSKDAGVYKQIGKAVDFALKDKLYKGVVDQNTKMSDIMEKVVLIIDKTIDRDYRQHTKCPSGQSNCYSLDDYISLESGTETLNNQNYTQILNEKTTSLTIRDDSTIGTDVQKYRLALPDKQTDNSKNPNIENVIMLHNIQIVPYRFYMKGNELDEYEELFNDLGFGIVPLSSANAYYTSKNA